MRKAKLIVDKAQTSLKRCFWFLLVVFSVTLAGFVGISKSGVTATIEELSLSRSLSSAQQKPGQETNTAEQVYKNIQVFKHLGVTWSEMQLLPCEPI